MATIALYAGKITQMSGFLHSAKTSVSDLKSELSTVKRKCGQVSQSICDLEEVIGSISATTKLQEDKADAMGELQESTEEFAEEAERIDEEVAELINENKEDFYSKYSYLKPDCEKTGWEKFCDGCQKTWQWCKENWEAICIFVAAVITVVAVIALCVLTFGAGAVAIAALVGALVGVAGQLISDTVTYLRTGKWQGTLHGYIGAAVGGLVGGVLALTGNVTAACALESAISSLISDSLGSMMGDDKKSMGEMLINAGLKALVGAVIGWTMGKVTDGVSKILSKNVPLLKRLAGTGSYSASYQMVLTKLKKDIIHNISIKTIRNGFIGGLSGIFLEKILDGFKPDEFIFNQLCSAGVIKFVGNH